MLIELPSHLYHLLKFAFYIPSASELYRGDHLTYSCSVEFHKELQLNIPKTCIPSGHYARFTHLGPMNEHTMLLGLNDWLPSSTWFLDQNRPVLFYPQGLPLLELAKKFKSKQLQNNQLGYETLELNEDALRTFATDIHIPIRKTL